MPYLPSADQYAAVRNSSQPARNAFYPTPSDTDDLPVYARSLKINTAGTIYVLPVEAYKNGVLTPIKLVVSAGEVVPMQIARIFATDTTLVAAGDIVAYTD